MKTELVDVNETRKNVHVEIPSDIVDAEIDRQARVYSRKVRIPGFRPGQGAGNRHQAALQGADPARCRERSDSAGGGRGVARARRGSRGYAGHPRRDGRGRSAADVHGVLRYAAAARAGRVRDHFAAPAVERGSRRGARSGDAAAARPRGAIRAGRRTRRRSRRHRHARSGAHGSVGHDRHAQPTSTWSLARRRTRPASTSSCWASKPGRPRAFRIRYPADYAVAELAGTDVELHGDRQGAQAPASSRARRRVREGSRRVRDARRAARARARRTGARSGTRGGPGRARAADEGARGAGAVRAAGRRSSSASSIGASKSSRTGCSTRRSTRTRRASTGARSGRVSARPRPKSVGAALVIDEVARREQLDANDEEVEREVAQYAERMGRTPAAVRAELEKEHGLSQVRASLRREKAIDFLLARATIA